MLVSLIPSRPFLHILYFSSSDTYVVFLLLHLKIHLVKYFNSKIKTNVKKNMFKHYNLNSFFNELPTPFLSNHASRIENLLGFFCMLLLNNNVAIFNQTWHKAFLGDRDSSLSKWRDEDSRPFSSGDNYEI